MIEPEDTRESIPSFENKEWYRKLTSHEHAEWRKLQAYISDHPELDQLLFELDLGPNRIESSGEFYKMVMLAVHFRAIAERAKRDREDVTG